LSQRVRFLGFRADVPALIAASDFVVVPSRWEGMPYVALEAMAAGKALVATPVDGARDVIEHGVSGLLARGIDPLSLSDVLGTMTGASSADRARMGRRGRERLLAGFTARAMVAGLVDVYREVA
jgi:glycosyltransferase involved in cell wall biosynthesis